MLESYESVSPTAILTSYPRTFTDIPYEKEIYGWLSKNCSEEVNLNKLLAPEIEARYKLANKLLDKQNATQVLEYLKELEKEDIIDESSPKVILLTPMFKESQPSDGGWRWHKWGSYIGVQKHEYEYLYDEKEVEMIYCFEIIPMKKRED